MKHREIAELFEEIADLLEVGGENVFRIRAYRRAAQSLENLTEDLEQLNRDDRLLDIPGIGRDLADKIREYLSTGAIAYVAEVRKKAPPGISELLAIPSIGPKSAKLLAEQLRITSLDELEAAARNHKICALPGFQEKKEQNILRGIEIIRQGKARRHLGFALPLAQAVLELLRDVPGVARAEAAGSLRRMRETVGDLDVLVTSTKPERVMQAFLKSRWCGRVLASGDTKASILTPDAFQIDLRVVEPDAFGAALVYFTGSQAHNIRLREFAVKQGLKINEYGVFREPSGKRIVCREEADVYKAVGLPWIPPEIREDTGEFDAAREHRLPTLVDLDDIRGDFHVHTDWSDGRDTLEQIAEHGRRRGYKYMVITDHSPSLTIARGLTAQRKNAQMREIAQMNTHFRGFRLLIGAEVDILDGGRMDYPNELLKRMDFVVGSVHSGFKQSKATMTNRILRAMDNPYVTMIGHPTGRLLGQREAYEVDLEAVYRHARETQTALEMNASPQRLDLNDAAARQAHEHGVTLALSTDTHHHAQLDYMSIGIGIARRAWLGPKDLLNTRTLDELLAWVSRKRDAHG